MIINREKSLFRFVCVKIKAGSEKHLFLSQEEIFLGEGRVDTLWTNQYVIMDERERLPGEADTLT